MSIERSNDNRINLYSKFDKIERKINSLEEGKERINKRNQDYKPRKEIRSSGKRPKRN